LNPPVRSGFPDHFGKLLASGVAAKVLEEAIAEHQIILAEAARTGIGIHDIHPGLALIGLVAQIDQGQLGRMCGRATPRGSRAAEVKNSHVLKVGETAVEFFVSSLADTVDKRSWAGRIDESRDYLVGRQRPPP
jgi:hypothetical protein